MNSQSQAKSPERLRAMVAGTLANFQHPTLKHNLTALKALHHVAWLDDTVHIELQMPFVWSSAFEALKEQCSAELLRITGAKAIDWKLTHSIATLKRVKNQPGVNGVKNIIAISSGKGGVGKSSTAVNLALALAAEGAKVGILDADIYGPSIPTMLGAEDSRPTSPDGTHMAPIMKYGLATNSIGYLVTDDNAMVWRGPMASKALMQMLQETLWPDLDYLVLDMPPGTGDIQLTLAQNIPVTGAVVVTTPQDIALIDAKKGIVMFEKVEVPVLGIVENMSMHICSNCGHHEPIFGTGGAQKLAEKYHTQLLGQLPLHITLREDLDNGTPTVVARPDSEFTDIYRQLAGRPRCTGRRSDPRVRLPSAPFKAAASASPVSALGRRALCFDGPAMTLVEAQGVFIFHQALQRSAGGKGPFDLRQQRATDMFCLASRGRQTDGEGNYRRSIRRQRPPAGRRIPRPTAVHPRWRHRNLPAAAAAEEVTINCAPAGRSGAAPESPLARRGGRGDCADQRW